MSLPDAAEIAALFTGLEDVVIRRGTFAGISTGFLALVDMGTSRFPCEFGADYIPVQNEAVQILSVGSRHLMFPLGAKPKVGTVQTSSSGATSITVQTSIGVITTIYVGTRPTSGQRVLIEWSEDGPIAVGVLSTTPAPPPPPPDPGPPGGQVSNVVFRAIDAGSTDRGSPRWWTGNPYASDSTYGAFFYGSAIKGTIPASAQFVGLQIKINRIQDQGGAPNFALHDAGTKGPIPGFGASTAWDPPNGWQTPPGGLDAAWFAALKAGGPYAGVGFNQGGFNIFANLAQDAESGALSISWRT